MQAIKYGLRESSVDSVNDGRSRYVPSSVYSGAGPVDDSPALAQGHSFMSGALRGPFEEQEKPPARFTQPSQNAPRNSTLLNINDPVAMHLLTETAISDSREFEVLSFEEVEQLKKERSFLRGKIETTRRKLALESKLRDAAQSLNRLYSTRESPDAASSPKKSRRSLLGSRHGGGNEVVHRADDEYAASMKKVEEFSRELFHLEKRLQDIDRRILQHTAGILQMTHRGLKKNIRRNELPRSPESMSSQLNGRGSALDARDDFDERSLYQVPDYVTDFGQIPHGINKGKAGSRPVDGFATRLHELNQRLHLMITQASLQEHFDPPPQPSDEHMAGGVDAQIQAYLGYMSQGLDAMEAAQARSNEAVQQSIFDTEEQLEDVNLRLHDMLARTNSVGHSPVLPQDEPRGKDLQSQLAFSSSVIERLSKRVETLIEQKDILTRQIQQQRELNSKSDAQRDAKIHELVADLEESKRSQTESEQEAQHSRDQINLLMEELDLAKQQSVLLEHERGADESKALELERAARKEVEEKFLAELQAKQEEHSRLQSEIQQTRRDLESKSAEAASLAASQAQAQAAQEEVVNDLRQQMDALGSAKAEAESALSKLRAEMQELESEVVRAQTELTVVKAELDGAYGTRAQRAADVSMNPAIQKEIDELNMRNNELESHVSNLRREHEAKDTSSVELQNKVAALQRELKETIEEYEVMTRQSIEDEKERERLEEKVDALQQQCEALESQLNEEKVKGLGTKVSSPTDTTSTMVLKNEFKKMMRETRAENLKVLKAEQEERRRLEGIIKSLKKDLQQRHSQKEPPSTPIEAADPR
ncbi:uncharacterized protein PV07_09017 [Cladophialophora immunda]|uniref:Uncharacterized protein n=1 Tax=Cladophialophora immunda TaxID=569365 RepID=A0A0D1ZDR6_9EURO|nr:uncharacterized protein PV07_09017 [Cladophialophora immunda]KIW25881.1 hypothetical protein PV07_09017 [Cladophialophora immunda]OQV10436.1 hypothetical protein CLAIMM_14434 isoform 3 [Cladophialophora immunda]